MRHKMLKSFHSQANSYCDLITPHKNGIIEWSYGLA